MNTPCSSRPGDFRRRGKKLDYGAHEQSQNFPDYGLTCLRAGVPGARLELMMDYQNSTMHVHPAAMNLQLFYQGVNLLPDIGYGTNNGEPNSGPWRDFDYPCDVVAPPGLANLVEAHCTGTALGSQFGHQSVVFERFLGRPQSPLQMVQVDGKWIYRDPKLNRDGPVPPVHVFNRQVATLTLPNGRALAVDFFRMKGGGRHNVYWHAPAVATRNSLGEPARLPRPNLLEHFKEYASPAPGWKKGIYVPVPLRGRNREVAPLYGTWIAQHYRSSRLASGGSRLERYLAH